MWIVFFNFLPGHLTFFVFFNFLPGHLTFFVFYALQTEGRDGY